MGILFLLLPVAAYVLLGAIFSRLTSGASRLDALMRSHVCVFLFVAVSTELLSLFDSITFEFIVISWILVILILFSVALIYHPKVCSERWRKDHSEQSRFTTYLLLFIVFVLVCTFLSALLYPPNTWDSMTYHMARVSHWMADKNIAYYPTSITRQNYEMPLAEFGILQLQILTSTDYFANLVQWTSFVVVIGAVYLIAGELGLERRRRVLAAAFTAALPMADLQASSTQNDLVVSAFIAVFTLYTIRALANRRRIDVFFAGLSLGLALLTKGTAYLFAAGIGLGLVLAAIWRSRNDFREVRRLIVAMLPVVGIALLLNTGYFSRNVGLYGRLLPDDTHLYKNEDLSAYTIFSNALRNIGLHLGTKPRIVDKYLYDGLEDLLGKRLNDPKTTWPGRPFQISPYRRHEDLAGNTPEMGLILLASLAFPVLWFGGFYRKLIPYAFALLMAAVLFSWILKWQLWGSRLQTPLFCLSAPLLAVFVGSRSKAFYTAFGVVVVFLAIAYSLPFAVSNETRPLIPDRFLREKREDLYFVNRPNLRSDYKGAIASIGSYHGRVGLDIGVNDWEYPFWVIGNGGGGNTGRLTFVHVDVRNLSGNLLKKKRLPSYIIATRRVNEWESRPDYREIFKSKNVCVFSHAEDRS